MMKTLNGLLRDPYGMDMELQLPNAIVYPQSHGEIFMDGLKDQVTSLEASLKPDQELRMICWHGQEKLEVLSVSMPSGNVVALTCRDADGDTIQVTGHMHSITFSFRIVTTKAPAPRNKIGFEMP